MADNKKSFVLYSDLETHIDLLTDDEAGRLFRHILAYVNDKNPEFKKEDRLLAVSFEPIKQQLKRDLKKYESIKIKRAEAGRKGGMSTQKKGEQVDSFDKKSEANQANASFDKQHEANQAVNDNVNDNVNVNDSVNDIIINNDSMIDNNNNQTSIQENDLDKISPDSVIGIETVLKLLKSEKWRSWRERFGMNHSLLPDKIFELLDLFLEHLKDQNQFSKSTKDAQFHFVSWYDKVYIKNNLAKTSEVNNDPDIPPDNTGKWFFHNNCWRDKTKVPKYQLEKLGLI